MLGVLSCDAWRSACFNEEKQILLSVHCNAVTCVCENKERLPKDLVRSGSAAGFGFSESKEPNSNQFKTIFFKKIMEFFISRGRWRSRWHSLVVASVGSCFNIDALEYLKRHNNRLNRQFPSQGVSARAPHFYIPSQARGVGSGSPECSRRAQVPVLLGIRSPNDLH